MPQMAKKQGFPGFGIVYPDGVRGMKVVKTFTQGSQRIHHPDGSFTYTVPPPTIHELFGGGFVYAAGDPVTDRSHLENIADPKMRERALKWFDTDKNVVPDNIIREEKKERPEPDYILSNTVPKDEAPPDKVAEESPKKDLEMSSMERILASISTSLSAINSKVEQQAGKIQEIEQSMEAKKRAFGEKRAKQSEIMKAKWSDPNYRSNVLKAKAETKTENEI